jgi:PEP-CTERM motif
MNNLSKVLLTVGLLAGWPGKAGTLFQIVFDEPDQIGLPGQLLTYSANLVYDPSLGGTNLGEADVFLGGDFVVDTSVFLNGPASLPGGGATSTGSFPIFTVAIPSSEPDGLSSGSLVILDINDNVLGSTTFSVELQTAPEPGTGVVLGVGLLGLLYWRRRQAGSSLE